MYSLTLACGGLLFTAILVVNSFRYVHVIALALSFVISHIINEYDTNNDEISFLLIVVHIEMWILSLPLL